MFQSMKQMQDTSNSYLINKNTFNTRLIMKVWPNAQHSRGKSSENFEPENHS